MTILAGAFAYAERSTLTDMLCRGLYDAISRNPSDERHVWRDERCYLIKVDIGALGGNGFVQNGDGTIGIVAGEPLLDIEPKGKPRTRADDIGDLIKAWVNNDLTLFRKANGTFCAALYDAKRPSLCLVPDKLGVRLLYYWKDSSIVVFATALRVLEALPEIEKAVDIRGVTELAAFGYCLAERTPYVDVKCLNAGKMVTLDRSGERHLTYWRWDKVAAKPLPKERIAPEAHSKFAAAVLRRLRPDEDSVVSFLSGGLDSRCIVAMLLEQGRHVHTLNFSRAQSLNVYLADLFAKRVETSHHSIKGFLPDFVHPSTAVAYAIKDQNIYENRPPKRARLVWSGDGGSVGAGFVYLTQRMADQFTAMDFKDGIRTFLEGSEIGPPLRALRPNLRDTMAAIPAEGIATEVRSYDCTDQARRLYLFLLLNDQRRHLTAHLENIDVHRVELQLPFYDGEFIELMQSVPMSYGLYHTFYHDWLKQFAPAVTSVPWQTYPGHLPCPLPLPEGLEYQWRPFFSKEKRQRTKSLARTLRRSLLTRDFPARIFRRSYLLALSVATSLGMTKYSYALDFVLTWEKYWRTSQGRCEFTSNDSLTGSMRQG
jgi:hypothetical protein